MKFSMLCPELPSFFFSTLSAGRGRNAAFEAQPVSWAPFEDTSTTAIVLTEYCHGFFHALWPVASNVPAQCTAVVISLVISSCGKGSIWYVCEMQLGYRANPDES